MSPRICNKANRSWRETENIELRHLPLAEAIEMVKQGLITDAISVAALLRIAISDQ